ncbi:MFS transporter [Legionella hackeliae]|uniref:MFS transporter n=2 Tax=Legionella hackeliae TaxID=449 RepID=A0A0A8UUC5_LEGHA|nr:MFS transporter [Legionella hackeliae]KTD14179.1 Major Facilitator Superfamily protein [Legionella hackeliae]CEK10389.1 membrane protein of unknown function [Legionella hackeliae]STX47124.1 Major Facilitator Superfamily [Legionella hackeliae]
MKVKKRLNLFEVEDYEFKVVAFMTVIQFFSGVALSIFFIAISAIFIHEVSVFNLYIVFIAASFLVITANYFYKNIEHQFGVGNTYYIVLSFSAVSLGLFYFALHYHYDSIIIAVFASYYIIYFSNNMSFWGVASQTFNVRESKRLFPLMSSGDLISKLVGYALAGLLAGVIALESLLLFSMISFVIANIFLRLMLKSNHEKIVFHEHHILQKDHRRENTIAAEEKKLISSICRLGFFCAMGVGLSEFFFLGEVKVSNKYTDNFAQFLGGLLFFGRLLALLFKVILSAKIEKKLGLKNILLILPIFIFMSMLMFFFIDPSHDYLYFLCLYIVLFEGIKLSTYEPYYFAMMQVVNPEKRLKVHAKAKGFFAPMGQLFVGFFILFYFMIPHEHIFKLLSITLGILSVVWVKFIIEANKKYYSYVYKMLVKYSLFNEKSSFVINDKMIERTIKEKIEVFNKKDSFFSVQYIYQLNRDFSRKYFLDLLEKNPPGNIVLFIMDKARENSWEEYLYHGRSLFKRSDDDALQCRAAMLLSKLNKNDFLNCLHYCKSYNRSDLLTSCISGGLDNKDLAVVRVCINLIPNKLLSSSHDDKVEGLNLIAKLGASPLNKEIVSSIMPLLNTKNARVRNHLINAIKSLKSPDFLPYLFSQLKKNKYANNVRECLANYSDYWLHEIKSIDGINLSVLIHILTKSKSRKSKEYLIDIFHENNKYHDIIVPFLIRINFSSQNKKIIRNMIMERSDKLGNILELTNSCSNSHLISALNNEKFKELTLIICYLHFINPIHNIYDLLRIVEQKQSDYYLYLIENIEFLLQKQKLNKITSVFEKSLLVNEKTAHFKETDEVIAQKILAEKKHNYSPWVIAVAVYFYPDNKELLDDTHYLEETVVVELLR